MARQAQIARSVAAGLEDENRRLRGALERLEEMIGQIHANAHEGAGDVPLAVYIGALGMLQGMARAALK